MFIYGRKDGIDFECLTHLLIETRSLEGTEWGISLTSSNPEPKDYIACKSKEDAEKLEQLLTSYDGLIKEARKRDGGMD